MPYSKKYLVANHKAYPIDEELLFSSLSTLKLHQTELILAPSFLHLRLFRLLPFSLAAQRVSPVSEGAFTGEIPASILAKLGVSFALIGHSERRLLFGESVESLRKQLELALAAGMTPIYCIGEDLPTHQRAETTSYLQKQLDEACPYLDRALIAYEPLFAIGSGNRPKTEEIAKTISFLQETTCRPILYGGSVDLNSLQDLYPLSDGLLVGGITKNIQTFLSFVTQMDSL